MATWTPQSKNAASFTPVNKSSAPVYTNTSKSQNVTYFSFLIDNTYHLRIDSTYKLLLGDSATTGATWTSVTKN